MTATIWIPPEAHAASLGLYGANAPRAAIRAYQQPRDFTPEEIEALPDGSVIQFEFSSGHQIPGTVMADGRLLMDGAPLPASYVLKHALHGRLLFDPSDHPNRAQESRGRDNGPQTYPNRTQTNLRAPRGAQEGIEV